MKYSIWAKAPTGETRSDGHATALSALNGARRLREEGMVQIQIIDIRTGRLTDEAALERAEDQAQRLAATGVRAAS
jgi:hypothetical protein